MKKFEITQEQIIELSKVSLNAKDVFKKWFPDAFKTELEVGKWYKFKETDNLIYIISKTQYYGFVNNDWTIHKSETIDYEGAIEATPQEVETALIAEAKKRELWGNKNIICAYHNNSKQDTGSCFVCKKDGTLLWGENGAIFNDGKWASVIETITKDEAEKLLNKKIV